MDISKVIELDNRNINKMKLELDNGSLTWQPTCVIYKGKRYGAPVFLTTLLAMDYIIKLLKTKQNG
jgi:hypothetical protein